MEPTLLLAGVGLAVLVCQWLAWRTKAPSILFLLLTGILAGPVLGLLDPDALLGELLFPVVSLAVAVILFEGSLTLRFAQIRGAGGLLTRLLFVGMAVTWAVVAVAAHSFGGLPVELAVLFGAIMVVTGPTVIGPMLRAVRPNDRVSNLLKWEGVVIDPLGAVLALIVFDFLLASRAQESLLGPALVVFRIFGVGLVAGCAAGWGLGHALRRHWVPEYLHNVATLLLVLAVFAGADALQHESGLVAVTAMGIWLANMREVRTDEILDFKASLTILLISFLFVLLAARLDGAALAAIGAPALLGVFVLVQFVARPLSVLASTWPGEMSWPERGILSWIAPRGIVAAAISSLFALKLEAAGFAGAERIVPLAFTVIIGTVVWQGLTAPALARRLRVSAPEPNGVLLVGSNPVSLELGKALKEAGFPVLVADAAWEHVREARMAGLATYYGNPVSAHADRMLDLTGIGHMLALSRREELNSLACWKFQHELGRSAVYSLRVARERDGDEKHAIGALQRGRELFGTEVSHAMLASLIAQGATLKRTRLTDTYGFRDLREQQPDALPLLAWSERRRLRIHAEGEPFQPVAGWTVLSLAPRPVPSPDDPQSP